MTEEYLVERNKKIKQTIGNGLAGIVGLGSLALVGTTVVPALAESAELSYCDAAVRLGITGSVFLIFPLLAGVMGTTIAIYNTIEMIRKDFSYRPIDYFGD